MKLHYAEHCRLWLPLAAVALLGVLTGAMIRLVRDINRFNLFD